MKKILFTLLFIAAGACMIIGLYDTKACENNPYSGQYVSQDNDNISLKLNSNNKCTFINSLYKEVFYTDGKYVIKNNHIKITLNKNGNDYSQNSKLQGVVEGSRVKLLDTSDHKYSIFLKE